jgi:uncharacterized protein YfaS (alpha-2-macroglobulin family)
MGRIENLGTAPLTHELILGGIPSTAPVPSPTDAVVLQRKIFRLKDLDEKNPIDPAAAVIDRNELLVVLIEGKLRSGVSNHGVLTDLLPAGWIIEAADLRPDLAIAPQARGQLQLDGDDKNLILRREAQDDRFMALIDLAHAAQGFRLAFLVRAAYPGQFVWPGTSVAGQDDASVAGHASPIPVTVKPD